MKSEKQKRECQENTCGKNGRIKIRGLENSRRNLIKIEFIEMLSDIKTIENENRIKLCENYNVYF